MCELLAPAGGEESFKAALNNGADAVYMGLPNFSARKNAENFTFDKLSEVCDYAHIFGVKVYIAVNTLIKNNELPLFFESIKRAATCGADAFIIQDMFLGKIIKEQYPDLVLHLSTQSGVNNVLGAKLAKEYGFSRVILARETALAEIKEICQIIETEVFIQGALCTAFSGQCYMSSFIGGNSGNRGLCKQPCRKKYNYLINGKTATVGYALSLSDLCVGQKIDELIKCGVLSFKIEGRMRRAEYVAAATAYYRKLIDKKTANISLLKRTYNRGDYTSGLIFGDFKNIISSKIQNHKGEKIGKILSVGKDTLKIAFENNYVPTVGDCFKIITDGYEIANATVVKNSADSGYIIKYSGRPNIGADVNITTDTKSNSQLLSAVKKLKVKVNAEMLCGKEALLSADCNGVTTSVKGAVCDKAKGAPLSTTEIEKCLQKTDVYPFEIELSSFVSDGVFMPKSILNELRRNLYSQLYNLIINDKKHKIIYKEIDNDYVYHNDEIKRKRTAIMARDFSFKAANFITDLIFVPDDFSDTSSFKKFAFDSKKFNGAKRYLWLPPFASKAAIEIFQKVLVEFSDDFDGVYSDGLYGLELSRQLNKECFFGTGTNIFNALDVKSLNGAKAVLSKELAISEIKDGLIKENSFVFNLGNIVNMNLIYCPFSKACGRCTASANNITLVDEDGRSFAVRRYKTDSCRFEIYNSADLLSVGNVNNNYNEFYNFVLYAPEKINGILDCLKNAGEIKNLILNCTNGNFKRGIL